MMFNIIFIISVITINILFLLLKDKIKYKKNKKKFWWPHDLLYEEYIKLCNIKKVKKINRQKYRKAVSLYINDKHINFIYKVRDLSEKDIKELASKYNIAQTFLENNVLIIVIIPWYDYTKKIFTIMPWK